MADHQVRVRSYIDQQIDSHLLLLLAFKYDVTPKAMRAVIEVAVRHLDTVCRAMDPDMAPIDDSDVTAMHCDIEHHLRQAGVYDNHLRQSFGQIACDYQQMMQLKKIERLLSMR